MPGLLNTLAFELWIFEGWQLILMAVLLVFIIGYFVWKKKNSGE